MKRSLWLFPILCCLIFAACREPTATSELGTKNTSVSTTTAAEVEIPDEISFEVSCLCELTDPEGKTLHCGGPNDFYGTIEGTPGRVYDVNPAFFEFKVPYRDYYAFQAKENAFLIRSCSCHFSRITARGPKEVIWNPDGWQVKSDGTDVTVLLNGSDAQGGGYLTTLTFHTDADADIVLTKDSISVSGVTGNPQFSVFDIATMEESVTELGPVRGGALKIDLSAVSAGTVKITADGENSDLALVWNESD